MKKIFYLCLIIGFLLYGCGSESESEAEKKTVYKWEYETTIEKDNINNALFYNGKYYFGSENGLYFSDIDFELQKFDNELPGNIKITDLFSDGNRLLLGTERGYAVKNGSFQLRSVGGVNCIIKGKENYFLGSDLGIYETLSNFEDVRLYDDTNSFFAEYIDNKDLTERVKNVNTLCATDEYIFAGTDEGLIKIEKGMEEAEFFYGDYIMPTLSDEYIEYSGNTPLSGNIITDLLKFENKLFIASNGGLNIYNLDSDSWENYTGPHMRRVKETTGWVEESTDGNSGLSGNYITALSINHDDTILVGTTRGLDIFCYERSEVVNNLPVDSVTFLHFNNKTLIVGTEFDGVKIFKLREREILL
ncbi:MAG: hypothetical protein ACQESP_00380 [Candidatus Muiribacteriota bacterium]